MATFEATRSPKCCPWTNQGYLTFPHTPRRPRPDPREAYTRAYPNRVGPVDLTLAGPRDSRRAVDERRVNGYHALRHGNRDFLAHFFPQLRHGRGVGHDCVAKLRLNCH